MNSDPYVQGIDRLYHAAEVRSERAQRPAVVKSLLTVHATMTRPAMNFSGRDIDRRDRHHGYSKCAYHYVIARDGTLSEFRKDSEPSILDKEDAKTALSVCLVGGADDAGAAEKNFTLPQWETLKVLAGALKVTEIKSKTPALTTEFLKELFQC